MTLQAKMLLPVIIMLLLVEALLGVSSYQTYRQQLLDLMKQDVGSTAGMVTQQISANQDTLTTLIKSEKINYLRLATSVSEMIARDPSILETGKLQQLAQRIGTDEIHVTDEAGILRYGTIPKFIGFDFHSSEQTKPFLHMGVKGFAQDPAPRGSDGKMFMYIGTKRQDAPGIVQIGLEPKEYNATLRKFDLSTLARNIKLPNNGFVLIYHKGKLAGGTDRRVEHPELLSSIDKEGFSQEEKQGFFQDGSAYIVSATVDGIRVVVGAMTEEYLSPLRQYVQFLMVVAVLSLLVAVALIWWLMNKTVIIPLKQVSLIFGKVSEGDLQRNISLDVKRSDTIGQLNKSCHQMLNNLREIVSRVNEVSVHVATASEELAATTDEASHATQQIALAIKNVASGTGRQEIRVEQGAQSIAEMSLGIEEIAAHAGGVAITAANASQSSQVGNQAVQNAIRQMQHIQQTIADVARLVRQLGDRSKEIGQIVEVITTISAQTNLLALNAAIEAARAGENGRGFAVVADEVRKLAEQSSRSAQQITELIASIQTETDTVVESIDVGNAEVAKGIQVVEEAEHAFQQIQRYVNEVAHQIDGVSVFSRSLSNHTGRVEEVIGEIASLTTQTAASSQQASAAAEEHLISMEEIASTAHTLSNMADELRGAVRAFNL